MNGTIDPSSSNSNEGGDLPLPSLSSDWLQRIVFLGTGTSGQVPAIHCVTAPNFNDCLTCRDSVQPGSRNRRGCTSVAVVGRSPTDTETSTIVIDCGKTFYSSALVQFPRNGIRRIKAVLLTHAHADAILGLDDLRAWTMGACVQSHVDIYLTEECMVTVQGMFPYLVDRSKSTGGGDVGTLRWHIIDPSKPFTVGSGSSRVQVQPLPVLHGFVGRTEPFWTLGFRIDGFSYVSDCHSIPESTTRLMVGSEVIVMDALKMDRHASHFSFSQALSFFASLPASSDEGTRNGAPSQAEHEARLPKLGLLIDFTHRIEHYTSQELVSRWRRGMMNWQLAHPEAAQAAPKKSAGRGEAGGPRWWGDVWDERDCERRLTVTVRGEVEKLADVGARQAAQAGRRHRVNGGEAGEDDEEAYKMAAHWIPPIAMSYDGMVLEFGKKNAR